MNRYLSIALSGLAFLVCTSAQADTLTLRTAAQDSQPKFIKDGNTVTGLCIDVFKAIERIDATVKFSRPEGFVPLPRIEYMMEQGDLDLFCGLAKTPAREAKFDFIDIPLYLTHSMLAARVDDKVDAKSFDDLVKLGNDGLVLVVAKTVHAEALAAHPGVRYSDTSNNLSDNLRLLNMGRGRFVFHSDFALMDEIKRDHLQDKVRLLPAQFLTEGRYIVVSKKAVPDVRKRLTVVLEKLHKHGDLAKLFKAYQPK